MHFPQKFSILHKLFWISAPTNFKAPAAFVVDKIFISETYQGALKHSLKVEHFECPLMHLGSKSKVYNDIIWRILQRKIDVRQQQETTPVWHMYRCSYIFCYICKSTVCQHLDNR